MVSPTLSRAAEVLLIFLVYSIDYFAQLILFQSTAPVTGDMDPLRWTPSMVAPTFSVTVKGLRVKGIYIMD